MNRMALCFAGLTIVLVASLFAAQHQPAREVHKATLEVGGSKLHLGMTMAEVQAKFPEMKVLKSEDNLWMVGDSSLQFTNGSLSYADRSWTTNNNNAVEALFGAVSSINNEGFSSCTVRADTSSDPIMSSQRVWILCGEKNLLIIRTTHEGKVSDSVYEELGLMRPRNE